MTVFIVVAMFLQLLCSVLRSFIGPLIIMKQKSPIVLFVDRYRLLVYSIVDFLIGVGLLFLFYSQGMTEVRKLQASKGAAMEELAEEKPL